MLKLTFCVTVLCYIREVDISWIFKGCKSRDRKNNIPNEKTKKNIKKIWKNPTKYKTKQKIKSNKKKKKSKKKKQQQQFPPPNKQIQEKIIYKTLQRKLKIEQYVVLVFMYRMYVILKYWTVLMWFI